MASRSPQHSGKTNNISLPTKQICHTNQSSSTGRLCYASHRRDSSACGTPTFVTHSAKSSLILLYNKGAFCRERRQFNLMLNTLNHEVIVVMSCRHDEICNFNGFCGTMDPRMILKLIMIDFALQNADDCNLTPS